MGEDGDILRGVYPEQMRAQDDSFLLLYLASVNKMRPGN
jgi:hypothetical protein